DEHDCRGRLRSKVEADVDAAEDFHQLVMNNLHDLLARTETLQNFLAKRLLPDAISELFNDFEVHVRFKKRDSDFLQGLFNVLFGKPAFTLQILKNALQLFRKRFKHRLPVYSRNSFRRGGTVRL